MTSPALASRSCAARGCTQPKPRYIPRSATGSSAGRLWMLRQGRSPATRTTPRHRTVSLDEWHLERWRGNVLAKLRKRVRSGWRTFYTSSGRPLPGTVRTAPDDMRVRYLPPSAPGGSTPMGRGPCAGKGSCATWRKSSPLAADRLSMSERHQPRCASRSRQWCCRRAWIRKQDGGWVAGSGVPG